MNRFRRKSPESPGQRMRRVIHADGAEEKAEDDDGDVHDPDGPAKGVPLDPQVEVTRPHEGQHGTCQNTTHPSRCWWQEQVNNC